MHEKAPIAYGKLTRGLKHAKALEGPENMAIHCFLREPPFDALGSPTSDTQSPGQDLSGMDRIMGTCNQPYDKDRTEAENELAG
jgi:hypothetical protein